MAPLSEYNQQQAKAILMVSKYLSELPDSQMRWLEQCVGPYLEFRSDVARFQKEHFADICSQKCFTSRTSACCGREGIITFFADVLINIHLSTDAETDGLLQTLAQDTGGFNCVYLHETGCLWRLKPIVCEMFLCDHAKKNILEDNDSLSNQWEKLHQQEKFYTWPIRPVLFDELEYLFIQAGFDSPLMYLHRSPGLLRLKAKHGLDSPGTPKVRSAKR